MSSSRRVEVQEHMLVASRSHRHLLLSSVLRGYAARSESGTKHV